MHHTLTHFSWKSVKNPYFCVYFQCEKLSGTKIFLSSYISVYLLTLIYHPRLIQGVYYLVSIMFDNFTKLHVHTVISFSVVTILWHMGRSFSIDLPNLADFAIMLNLEEMFEINYLPSYLLTS